MRPHSKRKNSGREFLADQTSRERIDFFLSRHNRVGVKAGCSKCGFIFAETFCPACGEERVHWTPVEKSEREFPLLHGNAIVWALKVCVERGDVVGALAILPGMACKHVRAVCEGRATITGDDLNGFKLQYKDGEDVQLP
jgi:hypothetical protein